MRLLPSPAPSHRRTYLAAAFLSVAALGGCGSSAVPAAPADLTAPLDTVADGPLGAWAILAMGHLDDPDNTFWQAFYRAAGAGSWSLRTPADVADNGGLVIAAAGPQLVIGVRPSNQLRFAPLALSTDHGNSYTPGLLPYGLADLPDALTTSPDGSAYALTTTGLLTSGPSLTSWHNLLTLPTTSAAASACDVTNLSALAATAAGLALGARCVTAGVSGIFLLPAGGSLQDISPRLPAGQHPGTVNVLRLVSYRRGLAAILGQEAPATTVTAAWAQTTPGPWTLSAPIPTGTITSTSVTATGTFAVLDRSTDGALQASTTEPGQATWTTLPAPPPSTSAIAVDGARIDALAVDVTNFTDYELLAGRWVEQQAISVPISFGSSG